MYHTFVNLQCLIAQLTLKERKAHYSDSVKPVVPLIRLSNCCRNDSLHRRANINTVRSTSRL